MKKVAAWAVFCGLLVVFLLASALAWAWSLLQPVNKNETQTQVVTVVKGQTWSAVADELENRALIHDALAFRVWVKFWGGSESLQIGNHLVSPAMSVAQVWEVLTQPPEQVTITILPGWRREEIAAYLAQQSFPEFDEVEFLALTADLEGRLMPETYKIAPLSTTETMVKVLHDQFVADVEANADIQAKVAKSGHSLSEILTLASLLQREARDAEQMRVIAGILENRLADHYPLQLCASAQYATGQDATTGKWWEPPTAADTEFDSPYNTYVYKGLPPGPICAVSMEALEAALSPAETDYYYYLHDAAGQIHYAKTLDQHNANKQYL